MYRIFYRLQERDVLKTHRVVRSITTYTNRTVEGLEHGESYKDIHGSLNSATIYNLESFRWYIIRIGGLTRAGLGPTTVVNASCGQGGKQTNTLKAHFHLLSDFAFRMQTIVLPSSYANVLRWANARMWTGNSEFASKMQNPKVSGNRP